MIDPEIIPHLSEALGAGYESIIHAANGGSSSVVGGKRKPARTPKRKQRMRGGAPAPVEISGGRSRRHRSRRAASRTSRRRRSPRRARSVRRRSPRRSATSARATLVRSIARLLTQRSIRR